MQNKILSFWGSLQAREKFLLQLILVAAPLFLLSLYFFQLSNSINQTKRTLDIAEKNFDYVNTKANNFLLFSQVQQALGEHLKPNDLLIRESQKFNLTNFRLAGKNGRNLFYFNDASLANVSKFLEKILNHPSLLIISISMTPSLSTYEFEVEFQVE